MRGVNKVILIGNLGKDPEVNHLEGGATVAKFTLATSDSYTDKSGKRIEQVEWHNIVCWNKLAEIAEKYFKKGGALFVEGKIRTRSYDKDGQKKYFTEIVVDNFNMLDRKPEGATSSGSNVTVNADVEVAPEVGDDLPF